MWYHGINTGNEAIRMDVLQNKIRKMKNPSMVGLDPTPELIPDAILHNGFSRFGETPDGLASAYSEFCTGILEALQETVPAVKLQTACFEALGAPGVSVLQELSEKAHELGYYVVMDSMRGDAPHIAELYARTMFGKIRIGEASYSPFFCDGLTLNGYLGSDAVKPFLPYCKDAGKDLYLLVKTSNRSGREVQDLISGDRVVHTAVADLLMRWSDGLIGSCGYSSLGAVMGATDSRSLAAMRKKYDRIFFLVAGYGAQGGTAKAVSSAFDAFGHGAVVTASRSILGAWKKDETDGSSYTQLALEAAVKMKKDIAKYVTVI